ncbi:MAG: choice-of-anchor tandem repeat GloVer-containing protein [Candidatus Cybelea sp.]
MLAGCGGSQPPIGAPGAMPQTSALATRANRTHYKVLYSFGALPDASDPHASLIDVRGTLYGTTPVGGSSSSCARGCGTVFSITTGGTEKVLYSFGPRPDGEYPHARLLNAGGTLYGTTAGGGAYDACGYSSTGYFGCGTVFSVTLAGSEKVVHSFGNGTDGRQPEAGLIGVKDTFYGTTIFGGAYDCGQTFFVGCGTVFSVTPSGKENVVFRFTGGRAGSGWRPLASLIDARGTLYGTTMTGGYHIAGVVFSLTTSGTEKVLHNFGKKPVDGVYPGAGLIDVKGTFYGTTESGGVRCREYNYGCGTVFSITPDGTEKVLHSFGSGTDGAVPNAGLISVKGTLYGTTSEGGAYSCGSNHTTCGTVFSIEPDGKEKVHHSFGSGTDGSNPNAELIDVNGTLYGTTSDGGTYGRGTVFALTP